MTPSWLKEVEICGEHVCGSGTGVHCLCTSYTFNSALSRGNIARLLRSEVNWWTPRSTGKGANGHTTSNASQVAHNVNQSRKDAAAKEAAGAAQAAPLSYASRPLYVAKIAHAINKQEGTDVCNQQDVPSVGPSC